MKPIDGPPGDGGKPPIVAEGGREDRAARAVPGNDLVPYPAPANGLFAQAARGLSKIIRPLSDGTPPLNADGAVDDLARALEESFRIDDSEEMLYTQARILDALFKRYAAEEIHGSFKNWDTGEREACLRENAIDLALKLQRHARTTIRALSLIRGQKRKSAET